VVPVIALILRCLMVDSCLPAPTFKRKSPAPFSHRLQRIRLLSSSHSHPARYPIATMSNTPTSTVLSTRIQQLVSERERHADAVAAIDQTLSQIDKLLGTNTTTTPSGPDKKVTVPAPKKSKRRSFTTTAAESVLEFVKKNGGATTKEIQKNWKSERRGGTADNTLSQLFKDKKLKRTPLKDQRGSRYTLL